MKSARKSAPDPSNTLGGKRLAAPPAPRPQKVQVVAFTHPSEDKTSIYTYTNPAPVTRGPSATTVVPVSQVTTIAVVSAGERMFVGTADGSLTAHECRGDTPNALKAGSFECREVRRCLSPPPLASLTAWIYRTDSSPCFGYIHTRDSHSGRLPADCRRPERFKKGIWAYLRGRRVVIIT